MKTKLLKLRTCAKCFGLLALVFSQSMSVSAQKFIKLMNGKFVPVSSIQKIEKWKGEAPNSLSILLEQDANITLYAEALKVTGVMDLIKNYEDKSYAWDSEQNMIDSCTWSDMTAVHNQFETIHTTYPKKRLFNYTVFAVTDDCLKSKYNITKVLGKDDKNSLEYLAHRIYDEVYPSDAGNNDLTSRSNALNRFISYHVLDRYGAYYGLTAYDGTILYKGFDYNNIDISDYYETLMPNSLIKFSFPIIADKGGLYINRHGVQDRPDSRGVFVGGTCVLPGSEVKAANGIYHYIDDVVDYGKQTQQVVLNERMRIGGSTLSPDFMTYLTGIGTARGLNVSFSEIGRNRHFGSNSLLGVAFKPGYVRNIEYGQDTKLLVRNRMLNFWEYQGEQVGIVGRYDVKVKLPSLPAGKYEIRLGTLLGFQIHGNVQLYIDDCEAGGPVDLVTSADNQFGWKSDAELYDKNLTEAQNDSVRMAHDKELRAKGWMKGPAGYALGGYYSSSNCFRSLQGTVRRIIGTFETDGKSDHYIRIKQVLNDYAFLNLEYIEIVPEDVYDNKDYAEDIY